MENASTERLITRHRISLAEDIPLAYQPRIAAIPGIRRVAQFTWFGGSIGSAAGGEPDWKNFFPNFAVEAEPYLAMCPEYQLDARREGRLHGRHARGDHRPGAGQEARVEDRQHVPARKLHPAVPRRQPFEFVVRAIYDTDTKKYPNHPLDVMLFHWKYFYEKTGQRVGVGTYTLQLSNPSQAAAVAKAVDATFENSDTQTKTETEAQFAASFLEMAGDLALILNAIGMAVAFTILLVTANTMSMAIRERRTEIAVLKTLGYPERARPGARARRGAGHRHARQRPRRGAGAPAHRATWARFPACNCRR